MLYFSYTGITIFTVTYPIIWILASYMKLRKGMAEIKDV